MQALPSQVLQCFWVSRNVALQSRQQELQYMTERYMRCLLKLSDLKWGEVETKDYWSTHC